MRSGDVRPKMLCPRCGALVAVNNDGTLRRHAPPGLRRVVNTCRGSGLSIDDEARPQSIGPGPRGVPEQVQHTAAPAVSAPLTITVHGTPAPQGSKRHVGNGVMVESSKKVKPWREAVKWAALNLCTPETHRGYCPLPIEEPVAVDVTFTLQRPRGHYRTGRNAHLIRDAAPPYPAGRPDLDKLVRSTLDGLGEAGVWHDDSQVVELTARKVYGDVAGACITITEATPVDLGAQYPVADTGEDVDPWDAA